MTEMVTAEASNVNKVVLEDVRELEMLIYLVLSKGFSSKPSLVSMVTDAIRDRLLAAGITRCSKSVRP